MKKLIKQLIVEIPEELHYEIKKQAVFKHTTIKQYVIESLIEKIKKEAKYQ